MEDTHEVENRVRKAFASLSREAPRLFRAPGRVNLIGEHTDYNNGFVLPVAIDRETIVAGALNHTQTINVSALDIGERATIDLASNGKKRRGTWLDYVEGTIRTLQEQYNMTAGADLVFASNVPIGSGLSSSAALEVAIGDAILSLNELTIQKTTLAFAAQKAEHEYVGTRSGIMDQFAAIFGRSGHALLIDCKTLNIDYIPVCFPETQIVITDSRVHHELASSEYNIRRSECEKAVAVLQSFLPGISSLRDVNSKDLERFGDALPGKLYQRALHVVEENRRTLSTVEAFENGDIATVGKLMFESHGSLRDLYEVSSPELDLLVETARGVKGVYGSRMTGGGFGGCTVSLIREDAIANYRKSIMERYRKAFGKEAEVFIVSAADGAAEML